MVHGEGENGRMVGGNKGDFMLPQVVCDRTPIPTSLLQLPTLSISPSPPTHFGSLPHPTSMCETSAASLAVIQRQVATCSSGSPFMTGSLYMTARKCILLPEHRSGSPGRTRSWLPCLQKQSSLGFPQWPGTAEVLPGDNIEVTSQLHMTSLSQALGWCITSLSMYLHILASKGQNSNFALLLAVP